MCDSLVALGPATDTGRTIFAKNSDRPPDEAQLIERHDARPCAGTVRCTYIDVDDVDTIGVTGSRPWWQWGFEHGINDAGVVAGNETIYTTLDPRGAPPALIGMDLVRLGLERAITAADWVDVVTALLERYGQGGSGHHGVERPYWSSFLVADRYSAFVLETSGREWAVEPVERTRAISNRTTIPAFDAAHRHPKQPVERLVDPRWEASKRVLADEPVTVEKVMRHLRSHDGVDGYSVCMHVPGIEATTASLVVELGDEAVSHWLLGSPCQHEYVTRDAL
ncbi:MAG TPA: hypothetical protein VFU93_10315 [Acidimicrobiales bacterium]|nr:hypothetical protein [Acidimicrobiales bacterium]